ncbi:leucine-rich repeat serine/threonine-protein kinase 1-like [Ptychodera flava]|uniref:leucine-rich repeat serine/threonine-protein kinase 1-like n=1 Tax=Ptychodera flava TaxID=63121 RepID=UPI00396A2071
MFLRGSSMHTSYQFCASNFRRHRPPVDVDKLSASTSITKIGNEEFVVLDGESISDARHDRNLTSVMNNNNTAELDFPAYTTQSMSPMNMVSELELGISDTEAFPGQLLHLAAFYGNVEFLQDLLHGEQKKYIDSTDSFGRTALHVACGQHSTECVKTLLEAGANANIASVREYDGIPKMTSPLHRAAWDNKIEMVKLLTANNADIYVKDGAGRTPYDLAITNRRMEVVDFLRNEAEKREALRGELGSDLCKACVSGDVVKVDVILDQLGPSAVNAYYTGGTTLLYKASEAGHLPVVHLLIEKGAEGKPNKTISRLTPLHVACNKGHVHIVKLLLEHFPSLAGVPSAPEELLPVHVACAEGKIDIVKQLLTADEEESAETSSAKNDLVNMSPARARLARSGSVISTRKEDLLFDINAVDASDQTPVYLASVSGHLDVVRLLLEYGAAYQPISGSLLSLNREKPTIDLETYSVIGQTALHAAVLNNNIEIARLLIRYGANVNAPIKNEIAKYSANLEIEKQGQTSVKVREADSNALIEACTVNNTDMIALLLKHGARDVDNKALRSALQARNDEVIAMLLIYTGVHMDGEYNVNRAPKTFGYDASLNASMTSLASIGTLTDSLNTLTLEGPSTMTNRSMKGFYDTMSVDSSSTVISETMFYSLPRKKKERTGTTTSKNPMPSTSVAITWHDKENLPYIKEEWLVEACLHVNHWLRSNISLENAFHALQAITRIDIANNSITELPLVIFQLHSLRTLNASRNKIEKLPKADFEVLSSALMEDTFTSGWHCPVLQKIDLSHNELEYLPQQLFKLPELEILLVSHNKLKSVPYAMWTGPKLTRLHMSYNDLEELPYCPEQGQDEDEVFRDTRTGNGGVSIDDVDVSMQNLNSVNANVTAAEKLPGSSRGCMNEGQQISEKRSVLRLGLKRYSVWRNSGLSIESPDSDTDEDVNAQSSLELLDISHNALKRVPVGLPCLAPKLTKLMMAHNRMREIGPLNQFPAGLKHLILSNNKLLYMVKSRLRDSITFTVGDEQSYTASVASTMSLCFAASATSKRSSTSSSSSSSRISSQHGSSSTLSSMYNMQCCKHRRHKILAGLKTLDLNNNRLRKLDLMLVPDGEDDEDDDPEVLRRPASSVKRRSALSQASIQPLFPELSQLKASNNRLTEIPPKVELMTQLTAIQVDGNQEISTIPPEIGRCSRIYDLRLEGCNMEEPFKTLVKTRQTRDLLGYLRSVLDKSKKYSRMKLMFVGVQGIGKTTLLNQLRREGTGSYQTRAAEGWARRQGNRNIDQKTRGGTYISTVGVDVCDWTYPKYSTKSKYGQVTFSTWDFGGQKEYYATHQYFLSKRSLYLLLWKITDGEKGVNELQQWLVNIQVRAPDSPVIIVGTHYDEVLRRKSYPREFWPELQKMIYKKFINIEEPEMHGLPWVLESIEVSCTRGHNIPKLRDMIYETAFSLRQPGPSNGRLLHQMIPATYLALEEAITTIVSDRYANGKDPVLDINHYRLEVMRVMEERCGLSFRDLDELKQATKFLHENGVLLHYEDVTLCNYVFVDPQWLCDMLAHVVTIREINPFAKYGVMKTSDLQQLFKATKMAPINIEDYILNLLNKFEVAVTWDNKRLIIPSMLPTEIELSHVPPGCEPMIPIREVPRHSKAIMRNMSYPISRLRLDKGGRPQALTAFQMGQDTNMYEIGMSKFFVPSPTKSSEDGAALEPGFGKHILAQTRQVVQEFVPQVQNISYVRNLRSEMHRLYLMQYIPSGYWSRLITRMLASPYIFEITRLLYPIPKYLRHVEGLVDLVSTLPYWVCWQTGLKLVHRGTKLLEIKEIMKDVNLSKEYKHEDAIKICAQSGSSPDVSRMTKVVISIPNQNILVTTVEGSVIQKPEEGDPEGLVNPKELLKTRVLKLQASKTMAAQLLSYVVEQIDTLLEDWYPHIGERFSQTLRGEQLIVRVAPCVLCYSGYHRSVSSSDEEDELGDGAWEVVSVSAQDNTPFVSLRLASPLEEEALRRRGLGPTPGAAAAAAVAEGQESGEAESTAATSAAKDSNSAKRDQSQPVVDEAADQIFQLSLDEEVEKTNPGQTAAPVSPPIQIPGNQQAAATQQPPRPVGARRRELARKSERKEPEPDDGGSDVIYGYIFEDCIHRSLESNYITCPAHGEIQLKNIVPDGMFVDLGKLMVIPEKNITRNKLLGKGAFGFVFQGQVQVANCPPTSVAIKTLHPCDPGSNAKQSYKIAYENAMRNWQYNPKNAMCRAYRTARQELVITGSLQHPHIVGLLGLCARPLSLLLELAQAGSLDRTLRNYRRNGCRLSELTVQKIIVQLASAVEYLHSLSIIHRDLKSENVLVWSVPAPHEMNPNVPVEVKLTDYGISRGTMPTGTKGYGGTEGFMAPEIIQYKGEETYTEKVDCFSFGMLMYELLALRHPYEGVEQIQQHVKDGIRPAITRREKVYPTYILDLMTWCWSQDPKHRPSAAQIFSVANTPEFAHLAESVSLEYKGDIMAACVVTTRVMEDIENFDFDALSGRDKTYIDILKLNDRCLSTDHEQFHLPKTSVESICAVNDTVWVALPTGHIQIYNAVTYQEMAKFPLSQGGSTRTPPIAQYMQYIPRLNQVLVAVSNGSVMSFVVNDGIPEPRGKYVGFGKAAYSLSAVPIHQPDKPGTYEVWCGQSDGYITILNADLSVKHRGLNHFSAAAPTSKNVGVYHMVTNDNTIVMDTTLSVEASAEQSVWTYVFPGSSVYRWDVIDRTIHGKLDCSKVSRPPTSLRPRSGSKSGSGRNKCHVTSMAHSCNHLYIGTSWGQLLVVEPFTMTPYTVFHCHEQPIKAILPVRPGICLSEVGLHPEGSAVLTIGRGHKNLIGKYPNGPPVSRQGSGEETYVLTWNAEYWM